MCAEERALWYNEMLGVGFVFGELGLCETAWGLWVEPCKRNLICKLAATSKCMALSKACAFGYPLRTMPVVVLDAVDYGLKGKVERLCA